MDQVERAINTLLFLFLQKNKDKLEFNVTLVDGTKATITCEISDLQTVKEQEAKVTP